MLIRCELPGGECSRHQAPLPRIALHWQSKTRGAGGTGSMQVSQMQLSYVPADLPGREHFPYYAWMRGEGIPIHFAVAGISDITAVPRVPWPRTGTGRGVFLELDGTYQAERGMFVCEI